MQMDEYKTELGIFLSASFASCPFSALPFDRGPARTDSGNVRFVGFSRIVI